MQPTSHQPSPHPRRPVVRMTNPSAPSTPRHNRMPVSPLSTPGISPGQVSVSSHSLGHGSFGAVYRGTYAGSPVAIKVCPIASTSSGNNTAFQHFKRETERFNQIRHPSIVQFFCVVHDAPSSKLYLVTELMKGGSLYHGLQILRRKGFNSLPLAAMLHIAMHISNGLAYLHACAFSFGDLKTMNILLSEPVDVRHGSFTPTTHAKLCDFGLSRNLDRMVRSESVGSSGQGPAGTYAYLAPEAFSKMPVGDARAAKAVDVYALGVVLWELATLQTPWQGKQALQLIRLVVNEGRRPEWPARCTAPQRLRDLITMCWHADPSKRPSSQTAADELARMADDWCSSNRKPVEDTRNVPEPPVLRKKPSSMGSPRQREQTQPQPVLQRRPHADGFDLSAALDDLNGKPFSRDSVLLSDAFDKSACMSDLFDSKGSALTMRGDDEKSKVRVGGGMKETLAGEGDAKSEGSIFLSNRNMDDDEYVDRHVNDDDVIGDSSDEEDGHTGQDAGSDAGSGTSSASGMPKRRARRSPPCSPSVSSGAMGQQPPYSRLRPSPGVMKMETRAASTQASQSVTSSNMSISQNTYVTMTSSSVDEMMGNSTGAVPSFSEAANSRNKFVIPIAENHASMDGYLQEIDSQNHISMDNLTQGLGEVPSINKWGF